MFHAFGKSFALTLGVLLAIPAALLVLIVLMALLPSSPSAPTIMPMHAGDVYAWDAQGLATAVRCVRCRGAGVRDGSLCLLCRGSGIQRPDHPWRVRIVSDNEPSTYELLPTWY